MLSHETAAEVHGIIDAPLGTVIHVTVPLAGALPSTGRRAESSFIGLARVRMQFVGPFKLPRTRVEDTVLDLVAAARIRSTALTRGSLVRSPGSW